MTAFTLIGVRVLRWVRRPPDFVIGPPDDPYMRRWWLLPRNRVLNVYLHHVRHDDDDRALHDHPWASLSILLRLVFLTILMLSRPRCIWNSCRKSLIMRYTLI